MAFLRDHILCGAWGIWGTLSSLPPVPFLTIGQGLYGAFVVKFNLQVAAFRRKHLSTHGLAEAVTLALLTALVSYGNRFLRIDMTESMAILFRECDGGGDYDNLCQCVFLLTLLAFLMVL